MFTIEGTGEIIAMQGLQFFIIVKGKKNLTMNRPLLILDGESVAARGKR
jgi:hypothetical protein